MFGVMRAGGPMDRGLWQIWDGIRARRVLAA